jgi:hypothetical protein
MTAGGARGTLRPYVAGHERPPAAHAAGRGLRAGTCCPARTQRTRPMQLCKPAGQRARLLSFPVRRPRRSVNRNGDER